MKINIVSPKIWNFELLKGENAWKEIVYSARLSGVPPEIKAKKIFQMLVKNDYGSALEHIIVKFDIKMSKGAAPELLEHRIVSHTGYSTRYINADKRHKEKETAYEIIAPFNMLRNQTTKKEFARNQKLLLKNIRENLTTYENLIKQGVPREFARYILPFSQAVGIYHFTINLRSLLNLLSLRLCVRTSPEFRCLASQLYFYLTKRLPVLRSLVGCRGFMRGLCPESEVTGVRKGKQSSIYPVCVFKNPGANIFIPTVTEARKGVRTPRFNLNRAILAQEALYKSWAKWE